MALRREAERLFRTLAAVERPAGGVHEGCRLKTAGQARPGGWCGAGLGGGSRYVTGCTVDEGLAARRGFISQVVAAGAPLRNGAQLNGGTRWP